jgi:hypothetical protein
MLALLIFALSAIAFAAPSAFTGKGNILVVAANDWTKALPENQVGCLNDDGRFTADECGVFTAPTNSYTNWWVSSRHGNCTFEDSSKETNTDSIYGKSDHAFTCKPIEVSIYEGVYSIVSGLGAVLGGFANSARRMAWHIPGYVTVI